MNIYLKNCILLYNNKLLHMDLKQISFCNTISYNICSNNCKEWLLKQISDTYNISYSDKSIRLYEEQKHKILLSKYPYLMSVKSIGNSYLMYLTKYNNRNMCFLIDKKILKGYSNPRIILVKYRFTDKYYNGTIMEVDLIKDINNWKLTISDMWINCNEDIRDRNLIYRLTEITNLVKNNYLVDPLLEPCNIYVKKYYNLSKTGKEDILKELKDITYKSQGIIFTANSNFKPGILLYLTNTDTEISSKRILSKKVRNPNINNNKSFVPHILPSSVNKRFVEKSGNLYNLTITSTSTTGIYQLYCNKIGRLIKFGIARIDGLRCLQFVRSILANVNDVNDVNDVNNVNDINDDIKKNGVIVKCHYDSEFKKFIPKELSDSKNPDEYNDIIYYTNEKM